MSAPGAPPPPTERASDAAPPPTERVASLYEAIGGEPTFRRLVDAFYAGVSADPVLRAIYPEDDLGPAADRLRMFLIQYWGGPTTYSQLRGHPRLRMRHAPFAINAAARDAWLRHMRAALDTLALPAEYDEQLWAYLQMAAESLRNTPRLMSRRDVLYRDELLRLQALTTPDTRSPRRVQPGRR